MAADAGDPNAVAIVGAVTGVVALVWNIGRSMREGARLHISFYVYEERRPEHHGPAARIDVANVGKIAAYITSVGLTERLPWTHRAPGFRSMTFRARHRRPLRWLARRLRFEMWNVPTSPPMEGRLEAGEAREVRLVDIVNDEAEPMDAEKVESMLTRWRWAVVETGLRQYVTRVVDNRP